MPKIISISGVQSTYAIIFEDAVSALVDELVPPNSTNQEEQAACASGWLKDIQGVINYLTENPAKAKELWWKKTLVCHEAEDFILNEEQFEEDDCWTDPEDYAFLPSINPEVVVQVSGFVREVGSVYPSDTISIFSLVEAKDKYKGAHNYFLKRMIGLNGTQAEYEVDFCDKGIIQFVKREEDGTFAPGLQNEQLVLVLKDRIEKLNAVFPSEHDAVMIQALDTFLAACKARVDERTQRGVMGKLEK